MCVCVWLPFVFFKGLESINTCSPPSTNNQTPDQHKNDVAFGIPRASGLCWARRGSGFRNPGACR